MDKDCKDSDRNLWQRAQNQLGPCTISIFFNTPYVPHMHQSEQSFSKSWHLGQAWKFYFCLSLPVGSAFALWNYRWRRRWWWSRRRCLKMRIRRTRRTGTKDQETNKKQNTSPCEINFRKCLKHIAGHPSTLLCQVTIGSSRIRLTALGSCRTIPELCNSVMAKNQHKSLDQQKK